MLGMVADDREVPWPLHCVLLFIQWPVREETASTLRRDNSATEQGTIFFYSPSSSSRNSKIALFQNAIKPLLFILSLWRLSLLEAVSVAGLYCQSCAGQMTLKLSLSLEKRKQTHVRKMLKYCHLIWLSSLAVWFSIAWPRCCRSLMTGNRNEVISAFPSRQLCGCRAKFYVVTELCLIKYLKNQYKSIPAFSHVCPLSQQWQQLCNCTPGPEALRGANRPGKSLKIGFIAITSCQKKSCFNPIHR